MKKFLSSSKSLLSFFLGGFVLTVSYTPQQETNNGSHYPTLILPYVVKLDNFLVGNNNVRRREKRETKQDHPPRIQRDWVCKLSRVY